MACCILMYLSTELKCFYDRTIKNFYDTLNIVVILAPGHEFFSAKCAQIPLTQTE